MFYWRVVLALILLFYSIWCVEETPTTSTPIPSSDTVTGAAEDLDLWQDQIGYVALPERGLLLERTGTLIGHSNYDVVSVVISLTKYTPPNKHNLSTWCKAQSERYHTEYATQLRRLEDMTEAIFLAREQLTSTDLCETFSLTELHCNSMTNRKKRFFMSAVALTTAGTALGLSLSNKKQLAKIQQHLDEQEDDINILKQAIVKQGDINARQIKATTQLFGFVKSIREDLSYIDQKAECLAFIVQHLRWKDALIKELESVLQFILKGQTYGRLTPSLLDTDDLKYIVKTQIGRTSDFYSNYYHILYQTGTATLMDANFNDMVFHFLLMYPNVDKATLAPFFAVKQVGFLAHDEKHNTTICLQFQAPEYAIISNDTWYMLSAPLSCKIFGRVMLCQNEQYTLLEFSECLRISNVSSLQCPMSRCSKTRYISTPAGTIIRTTEAHVTITISGDKDDKITATAVKRQVPSYQTIFIEWESGIKSVQFEDVVIYSPIDVEYVIKIYKKPAVAKPNLNWADMLNVPDISAQQIADALTEYSNDIERIGRVEALLDPSKILSTILQIPKWIKAVFYIICAVAVITGVLWLKRIFTYLQKMCKKSRGGREKKRVRIQLEPLVEPVMAPLRRAHSIISIAAPRNTYDNTQNDTYQNDEVEYMQMYPTAPVVLEQQAYNPALGTLQNIPRL